MQLLAFWLWTRHDSSIAAHFSPKGGCAAAIVAELNRSRSEILVMAYSFSCPDIANALIAASGRGVRVAVLLDRSNEAESYSELGDLRNHKIDVLIDAHHAIAHNKVIIIDRRIVLTGSFNFTDQAEHENAENLLILGIIANWWSAIAITSTPTAIIAFRPALPIRGKLHAYPPGRRGPFPSCDGMSWHRDCVFPSMGRPNHFDPTTGESYEQETPRRAPPVPPGNRPQSGPPSPATEEENPGVETDPGTGFQEQDPKRRLGDFGARGTSDPAA